VRFRSPLQQSAARRHLSSNAHCFPTFSLIVSFLTVFSFSGSAHRVSVLAVLFTVAILNFLRKNVAYMAFIENALCCRFLIVLIYRFIYPNTVSYIIYLLLI